MLLVVLVSIYCVFRCDCMDCELESQVWQMVQKTCDKSAFVMLIEAAFDSYRRAPGLDASVRLHASVIGVTGIEVLRSVMLARGLNHAGSESYLQVRASLKTHLNYRLQKYLVNSGHAIDAMKEDQLGWDLGL